METRRHGRGGAGILFWRKGASDLPEILLGLRARSIRHAPGTWSHPGGSLHPGEDPLCGAVREAEEETGEGLRRGLFSDSTRFREPVRLRVLSFRPLVDYEYTTYSCEVLESPPRWPSRNWEHEDFGWFPVDRLPSPLHREACASIRELLGRLPD